MTTRSLPTAIEAERVTIRSILLDSQVLPVVMQTVDYGDFHDEQLRAIYRTIVRQHLAGSPVDPVLIAQELRGTSLFPEDAASGRSIALVLTEIAESASTAAHAEHYARIVAKVGQRRRAILQTTDALDRLWRDDDANEVLALPQRTHRRRGLPLRSLPWGFVCSCWQLMHIIAKTFPLRRLSLMIEVSRSNQAKAVCCKPVAGYRRQRVFSSPLHCNANCITFNGVRVDCNENCVTFSE